MPNWVNNRLVINGDMERVTYVVTELGKPIPNVYKYPNGEVPEYDDSLSEHKAVLSFFNIIKPQPEELDKYHDGDWYEWNRLNWGCKWDADSSYIEQLYNGCGIYIFDTPWSPPAQAIKTLSEQYPDLTFTLEYEEETRWGGHIVFRNGEILSDANYDAPDSHVEEIERNDGYCYRCDDYNPDEMYPDCPAYDPDWGREEEEEIIPLSHEDECLPDGETND